VPELAGLRSRYRVGSGQWCEPFDVLPQAAAGDVDDAFAFAAQIFDRLPLSAEAEHDGVPERPRRGHRSEVRGPVFVERREQQDRGAEVEDRRLDLNMQVEVDHFAGPFGGIHASTLALGQFILG
jgi:hypothetical protein